jgi:hypothetical protein
MEREKKRKGRKMPFWGERTTSFKIYKASFLYLESHNTGPFNMLLSDVPGASK